MSRPPAIDPPHSGMAKRPSPSPIARWCRAACQSRCPPNIAFWSVPGSQTSSQARPVVWSPDSKYTCAVGCPPANPVGSRPGFARRGVGPRRGRRGPGRPCRGSRAAPGPRRRRPWCGLPAVRPRRRRRGWEPITSRKDRDHQPHQVAGVLVVVGQPAVPMAAPAAVLHRLRDRPPRRTAPRRARASRLAPPRPPPWRRKMPLGRRTTAPPSPAPPRTLGPVPTTCCSSSTSPERRSW